jgi:hypothetical protein
MFITQNNKKLLTLRLFYLHFTLNLSVLQILHIKLYNFFSEVFIILISLLSTDIQCPEAY